jgi:O-antigen ligase
MTREYPPKRRLIAAGIAALMLATIVLTKSRGGLVGLVAMLIALIVLGRRVRRGFGAMTVAAVLCAVPLMPASFWARMSSITDESEDQTGSREARQTVMREAWQAFLDHPLTGVGPGEFKDYNPSWREERFREAHDVWLQVASETGIVGALVFIALVVMACRNAWLASRAVRRHQHPASPIRAGPRPVASPDVGTPRAWAAVNLYSTAMTASLVGWLVCALFASVAYTWTFYYVFGISMAARLVLESASPAVQRVSWRRHPPGKFAAA